MARSRDYKGRSEQMVDLHTAKTGSTRNKKIKTRKKWHLRPSHPFLSFFSTRSSHSLIPRPGPGPRSGTWPACIRTGLKDSSHRNPRINGVLPTGDSAHRHTRRRGHVADPRHACLSHDYRYYCGQRGTNTSVLDLNRDSNQEGIPS